MKVVPAQVGEFGEITYLVYDEKTKNAVVVDPGNEAPSIDTVIEEEGLKLTDMILTHAHIDHILGIPAFRERYGVPLWMAEAEQPNLAWTFEKWAHILDPVKELMQPDRLFHEGDWASSLAFSVIHTPGHTSGSVIFVKDGVMLTGDTLFYRSIGRTDLPTGDPHAMATSIARLFARTEDYTCYPGHDRPTTLSDERRNNPYVLQILGPVQE